MPRAIAQDPSARATLEGDMSSLIARPARLYRVVATAEMVTWTLLLLGMLGKYVLDVGEWGVRVGGGLHGLAFLSYALVTALISVDQRWAPGRFLLGLGSAILPYATLPFERYAERHDLLSDSWRLTTQSPTAVHERVVSISLRRPLLSTAVGAVLVAVVFAGLLTLGPPTEWFD